MRYWVFYFCLRQLIRSNTSLVGKDPNYLGTNWSNVGWHTLLGRKYGMAIGAGDRLVRDAVHDDYE